MNQQNDLLQAHIETLYVLDACGDMRTTNEPYPPGRRQAPAFHLLQHELVECGFLCAGQLFGIEAGRHRVLGVLTLRSVRSSTSCCLSLSGQVVASTHLPWSLQSDLGGDQGQERRNGAFAQLLHRYQLKSSSQQFAEELRQRNMPYADL